MKIVGVAACTVGIAHTYIAQEKLENAAKNAGYDITIETQGTIGIENELTAEQIAEADVVILAVDVKISGRERFDGKRFRLFFKPTPSITSSTSSALSIIFAVMATFSFAVS